VKPKNKLIKSKVKVLKEALRSSRSKAQTSKAQWYELINTQTLNLSIKIIS